jgi:hypothetical protein
MLMKPDLTRLRSRIAALEGALSAVLLGTR